MAELPDQDLRQAHRGGPARPTSPSAFGWLARRRRWALEDRLVDLSDSIGHFSDLFDPAQLGPGRAAQCEDRASGPCTACRWAGSRTYTHVWKSLLERAGFTLDDIPREWEAFWSFWCDEVQPAVRHGTGPRRRLGRGAGPMSVEAG